MVFYGILFSKNVVNNMILSNPISIHLSPYSFLKVTYFITQDSNSLVSNLMLLRYV